MNDDEPITQVLPPNDTWVENDPDKTRDPIDTANHGPPPAIRGQADGKQKWWSDFTGMDFTESPSVTRQEFRDETEINTLLARYGVGQAQRPLTFGEANYDLDLQQALMAIEEAKVAHYRLPDHLKTQYPTWREFLNAVETGQLTKDGLEPPAEPPPAAPPAAPPA